MQIVNEQTHQVLEYVEALNSHGVQPHREMVNEFARDPERLTRNDGGMASMLRAATSFSLIFENYSPTETFCQYLARLGWIYDTGEVQLTDAGRALLKALNTPVLKASTSDVFEIVLSPENPFAYAQTLNGLASTRCGLLIEPYFRLDQLIDIEDLDNIERVLVGTNLKKQEYAILATGLASLPPERRLEVRIAKSLHDRYLIPKDTGSVLMLGMSLGGIGKKVSTLTSLGEEASESLRATYEQIWRESELLKPKEPAPAAPAEQPTEMPAKKATTRKATTRKATAKKPKKPKKAPAKKSSPTS